MPKWHLLLSLLLSVCLVLLSGTNAHTESVIVDRVDQQEITVSVVLGQRLTVRTPAAPITAYRWQVIEYSECLQEAGKFVESVGGDGALGAPVRSHFVFEATARCEGKIRFAYFAGSKYPGFHVADSFAVYVVVR